MGRGSAAAISSNIAYLQGLFSTLAGFFDPLIAPFNRAPLLPLKERRP
jgi:hypothetical protein